VPRLVCLQHVPFEGPGRLGAFAVVHGWTLETHLVPCDGLPGDAGDALLVMGGPMSVNDADAWISAERHFIARHVRAGTPYLGICLGSQFLASALGGRVAPGPAPEIGLHELAMTADGRRDPNLSHVPDRFGAFEWHGEAIAETPPGAVVLASSDLFPVQAFRWGARAYGFLFHWELDAGGVEALCGHCAEDVVRAGRSVADVRAETAQLPAGHALLDGFLRNWLGRG
jgi:GMP synthase-like glutamine amidotransferase